MKPKWTLHSVGYIYHYLLLADPTLKPHPHSFLHWRNWQRKKRGDRLNYSCAAHCTVSRPPPSTDSQHTLLVFTYVCLRARVCMSLTDPARAQSLLLKSVFLITCNTWQLTHLSACLAVVGCSKQPSTLLHLKTLPHTDPWILKLLLVEGGG